MFCLTVQWLLDHRACHDQIGLFCLVFPEQSADMTLENLLKAKEKGLHLSWLFETYAEWTRDAAGMPVFVPAPSIAGGERGDLAPVVPPRFSWALFMPPWDSDPRVGTCGSLTPTGCMYGDTKPFECAATVSSDCQEHTNDYEGRIKAADYQSLREAIAAAWNTPEAIAQIQEWMRALNIDTTPALPPPEDDE